MKCPLQRRHHERYSESLAVKIVSFEQTCPEVSKEVKSTRSYGACGILLDPNISHPRGQKIPGICTTLDGNVLFLPITPSGFARRPSFLIARASFGEGVFSSP